MKHITSCDNLLFKQLKKLADSSRERRKAGQALLDGAHLIGAYVEVFGQPELLVVAGTNKWGRSQLSFKL